MLFENIPIREMMKKRMQWLGQRQEVIAQNIANSDTPGFRPNDLKPVDFKQVLAAKIPKVNLAATDPGHLAGAFRRNDPFKDGRQEQVYETTPDGNSVVIEEQMVKLNKTQLDFTATTNLYRKFSGMIKIAIGAGGAG